MWKWILGLLVIIAAVVGAWKMGWLKPTPVQAPTTATSTAQQSQEVQSGLPTSQSDTSDSAVVQDSAAIDAQISGMSQDQAQVDQSLNDKQGTQSF